MPPKRPRPRPRIAISSTEDAISQSLPSTGLSKSPGEESGDRMFIRNTNRTKTSWKNVEARVKKTEELARSPSKPHLADAGLGHSETPSPRSRKASKQTQRSTLPSWTRENKIAILVNSSDEESDGESLGDDRTPRGTTSKGTSKGKRRRSRSRSITPPPPVPIEKLQHAHNLVSQAIGIQPRRPVSPNLLDDYGDDNCSDPFELDPELAAISFELKNSKKVFRDGAGDSTPASGRSGTVTINIKWIPHPKDDTGKEQFWNYEQKRSENFSDLFEGVANEIGLLSQSLVITYKNRRVFSSSTPLSLQIWSEAEFEACTTNTHDFIRERKERALSPSDPDDLSTGPSLNYPHAFSKEYESEADSDASVTSDALSSTFKLTLRSGSQEITVLVRPTTKCSAIVATFVKKTGRSSAAAVKARVEIDGEKLDPGTEIGKAELEDGDLVDIVGLK